MVFCIDFDNTCCFDEFPNIGQSVPGAINVLKLLVAVGHKIILWTARLGEPLDLAIQWFNDNNIKLSGVNDASNLWSDAQKEWVNEYGDCRKVVPDYYIDDRNLCESIKIYKVNNKFYKAVDWEEIYKILINKQLI